jgi:ssDNA-binding Zn-finger/Zn-ribbon topoisomerase 1
MTIEVRKYVPKDAHPLAPFWLHVAAPDVKAALAELEVALSDIKELSKPKEEAKPAVKVIKNPNHCALVKDLVLTKGKNYYFVRCSEYDEAGMLIPAGLLQNDVDVKECFECKQFKPKEVRA